MKTFSLYPSRLVYILCILFLGQLADAQIEKRYVDKNGNPSFIEFKDAENVSNTDNLSKNIQDDLNILQNKLQPNAYIQFKLINQEADELGFRHRKYQQYFKDIKVEFSTYTVHTKADNVTVINGKYTPIELNTSTTPNINNTNALEFALNYLTIYQGLERNSIISSNFIRKDLVGELVFIQINSEPHLAYKFNIFSSKPLQRNLVFVDANNGNILFSNAILHDCFSKNSTKTKYQFDKKVKIEAKDIEKNIKVVAQTNASLPTRYAGNQTSIIDLTYNTNTYRLRDYSRGKGIETFNVGNLTSGDVNFNIANATDFTSTDNNWTTKVNKNKDNAAFDVHIGTQNTYDFFKNIFNRNSIDGNGYKLRSYVHYLKGLGENYVNAFWSGEEMFYGDGDNINYDPLVSQDVVSHELGHGFCQNSANLIYEGESGALNEALSDIWGATIEYFYYPNKKTWLIGEDFDLGSHTGFRNMATPNAKGNPDTYRGKYWNWNMVYDHGGVHLNSGVINHWYYLVSQGGNGTNDFGVSYAITGIGIMSAAKIVYRTETQYLSAQSEFLDFRIAAIKATEEIYGANSKELATVKNAFAAVGISNPLLPAQLATSPTPCSTPVGQMVCGIAMTADNNYSGFYAASGIISNSSNKLFLSTCNFNFTGDLYVGLMQVKPNSSLILEAGKVIKIESSVRKNGGIGGLRVPYGSTFKAYICSSNNNKLAIEQDNVAANEDQIQATKEEITIINEKKELKIQNVSINAYPNPVSSMINVEFELKESTKMSLLLSDMKGRKPLMYIIDESEKESGVYNITVDCSSFQEGVYLLVLNSDKGNFSQKIVVSR
ncbi:M4 family metallopeptidase [Emticicia sp. SJ17W-69]|uniref:M4 family metallopeptidase n=1 Tax=Emticicia sp. SJ17W-69 TaxID=3421657 RepID=UPI003EB96F0A